MDDVTIDQAELQQRIARGLQVRGQLPAGTADQYAAMVVATLLGPDGAGAPMFVARRDVEHPLLERISSLKRLGLAAIFLADAMGEPAVAAEKARYDTELTEASAAAEREAWASYFETRDATVGAPPLTWASAAELLRGPRPFGTGDGRTQ